MAKLGEELMVVNKDAFHGLISKIKKIDDKLAHKALFEYNLDRGKTEPEEVIITECKEFYESTKSQGVRGMLEMFYLELIDRYELSAVETVKIAARFNSTMARFVDDIRGVENERS